MTLTVLSGDTLSTIAARVFPGGDVRRFVELAIENPDLNIFEDLPAGLELNLPSTEQIENFARPALFRVATSLGGARGFLGEAEEAIDRFSGQLPPQLQGYAQEALDLVGEANGVLDQAETALDRVEDQVREYAGRGTNLVSWLLSGRS